MLAQTIWTIRYKNCHSIVNIRSNVIFLVKLIHQTNVFGIQSDHGSLESSEFVNLFAKSFVIINIKVLLNKYKKRARKN